MQTPFHGVHRGRRDLLGEIADDELLHARPDIAESTMRLAELRRDQLNDRLDIHETPPEVGMRPEQRGQEGSGPAADVQDGFAADLLPGIIDGQAAGLRDGARAQGLLELCQLLLLGEVLEEVEVGAVGDLGGGAALAESDGLGHGAADVEELVGVQIGPEVPLGPVVVAEEERCTVVAVGVVGRIVGEDAIADEGVQQLGEPLGLNAAPQTER